MEINIRFVEENSIYKIQRRTIFGKWVFINYIPYGLVRIEMKFISTSKQQLIDKVLENYYEKPKSKVKVIEHPMIKIY